jgi:hypothetical protein
MENEVWLEGILVNEETIAKEPQKQVGIDKGRSTPIVTIQVKLNGFWHHSDPLAFGYPRCFFKNANVSLALIWCPPGKNDKNIGKTSK